MKNLITVFLFFLFSCFGAFANEPQINNDSNLVFEGLPETILHNSIILNTPTNEKANSLVCGFSGNISDGNGEVIGHWYSSCTHAHFFIWIIMC